MSEDRLTYYGLPTMVGKRFVLTFSKRGALLKIDNHKAFMVKPCRALTITLSLEIQRSYKKIGKGKVKP